MKLKSFKFSDDDLDALNKARTHFGLSNDSDTIRLLLRNATSMTLGNVSLSTSAFVAQAGAIPTAEVYTPKIETISELRSTIENIKPKEESPPSKTPGLDSFAGLKPRGNPHATLKNWETGDYPEDAVNID